MERLLLEFSKKSFLIIVFLVGGIISVLAQPTFTSVPASNATNASQSADIVLTFNEGIRDSQPGNTTLDNSNVDGHITLKLTNAGGADIPFDATINGGKTVVTINPSSNLPSGAIIYVAVLDVEAVSDDSDISPNPTFFTFTVIDYVAPVITFNPANAATNVSISANIVISFDENIFQADASSLTNAEIEGGVVELKVTDNAGAAVPFTANFNGTNSITIDPNASLSNNTTYYVELNPVEDATGNETVASSITFSTPDTNPPVPTFSPLSGTVGVVESSNITISFNEQVRKLDNSALSPADLATLVELKLTDNSGSAVPFTASINGGNDIITINPTSNLAGSTLYYVEINPIEDFSDNAIVATNITFTTGNTLPPDITFNPAGGAANVPVASNLTITLSEPIRKLDDSAITPADLATLVELKLTNDGGAAVPFSASIDGTKTIITVDPTSNFTSSTLYYLELNPVEDVGNNATVATNITFTSADIIPPVPTFNPLNTTTGVIETNNITITFNEAIRKLDDSPITAGDLLTLVELKLTNNAGANVPFTATLTGGNTIITIDPTSVLAGNTQYYVEINPVEDGSNNAIVATNIIFTTGDTQPPTVTFSPLNSATNFSAKGNIIITFNEPIRKTDDSAITPADIQGGLVELKLSNNGGTDIPFTATINVANTIITIDPNATLTGNQVYYVEMNIVEDGVNNATSAQNITFTTENNPAISSFVPAAAERCIGDPVTINGSRFTGTGNPLSGNAQPTVYINGVAVAPANITSFNATQIIFTLPSVTTGNFPITVRNNDSDLLSSGSSFDVRAAIDVTLPVTPATLNPAQNTNVNVSINPSQSSSYNYSLILTSAPGGFTTPSPTATIQSANGNSGNLVLNTANGSASDLTSIGDYTYRIDVSRTNCITKTLNNTPFTLTVASLAVNVNATNTNVCLGSTTTLIGSASGGTGFYQFRWTSTPAGYSSSSSSPTVSPTANIRYNLEVEDNVGNIVTDFVDISVNPVPTATIVANPGETAVRVNYVVENRDYLVSGTPSGGVFTGQGIVKKSDGNYYFNPFNAGLGNWPIVYTFTDVNGCQDTDTRNFVVQALSVDGVSQLYCKNIVTDTDIKVNIANAIRPGYQFTRLRFYGNTSPYYYDLPLASPTLGTPAAVSMPVGATYPLTLTARDGVAVNDIQFGTPINLPTFYTLNLDHVRNGWGYGYYYIDVFGKDAAGNEVLQSWAFFRVVDNGPAPGIVGINELQNVCSDGSVITLSSTEPGYTITNFSMAPGAYAASLSGTNNRDFNPTHASLAGADERALTVTMAYNDFNGCPSSVNRNFNWVKKPNAPLAADVEFCQVVSGIATSFIIPASPNGPSDKPVWYEQDPILNPSTPVIDSVNFNTIAVGVTGLVPLNKTFYVTQKYKGCRGAVTPVDIEIKPAPTAAFTPPVICQGKDFNLSGPIDIGLGQPYDLYEWFFEDGTSAQIPNNQNITHNYSNLGSYKISLRITNSRGCNNSELRPITVGLNPKPTFTYSLVCEGDQTEFIGSADIGVTEFEWAFGDGSVIPRGSSAASVPLPNSGTFKEPKHTFTDTPGNAARNYDVTVTSYTNLGCFSSTMRTITILDTLTRSTNNPYVMNIEESGKGYWRVEDISSTGNSTWEFAQPTTEIMELFTTPAWVTNATGTYAPEEKSFLNSPCFNISNIQRPVLSLDLIVNTDKNREGAVLEYSKNGGITWSPVGGVNSGLNWFNTSGFGLGTIGSSPVGWSGDSWDMDLEDNPQKDTLVQGRRALDNIPNLSQAERSNVRFRIAFATDAFTELEGFGFNNLTIDSRDRVSLVENFTNESDAQYASNNTAFKVVSGSEVAKIQYHLGFPGNDTNYPLNTADPSARAAFYGIPLTDQYIPRGYIDGFSDGRFDQPAWILGRFNKQALKNSPYTLSVDTQVPTDPSYLKIAVTITANVNIPATKNSIPVKPILHMAVVEKTVGNNEFVLRKLVPSAAGTLLTVPMAQNTTLTITENVRIENTQDVADLALVVFIQDELTKEVYQAGLNLTPTNLPTVSVITGLEDIAERIQIYPNPANESFVIELPGKAESRLPVSIIDQVGRPVQEASFEKGEQTKTVRTQDLAGGIYIVQIGAGKSGVIRKKVMVVHKN